MESISRVLRGHPGLVRVAVGQVGALLLGAVFWFVLARLLEPGEYGWVNWLMSVAMLASTCCVLGWGKTVVSYYPREGRDDLLGGAVMIVFVASVVVGVVFGFLLEPSVGLFIVGFSLFTMVVSFELGKRRYDRYMWVWIGVKLISLPLSIALYFWQGLFGVVFGYAIPHLIFGLPSLRYLCKGNPGIKEEVCGKLKFAMRVWGVDVSTGLTTLLDKVLIGGIFGMFTLGLYQLAYQFFAVLSVLPSVLFSYLLPEKSAGSRTREVEVFGILASAALAVVVIVLSPWLIPWVFPSFARSVGMIQIMSLGVIPSTIAMVKTSELYALGRAGSVLASYLAALVTGVLGIFGLGVWFGAMGLAVSVVLLQVVLAATLLLLGKKLTSPS